MTVIRRYLGRECSNFQSDCRFVISVPDFIQKPHYMQVLRCTIPYFPLSSTKVLPLVSKKWLWTCVLPHFQQHHCQLSWRKKKVLDLSMRKTCTKLVCISIRPRWIQIRSQNEDLSSSDWDITVLVPIWANQMHAKHGRENKRSCTQYEVVFRPIRILRTRIWPQTEGLRSLNGPI